MFNLNIKQKAFTLVEILLVVSIIGILATLSLISFQQSRINARDAKRVSDLNSLHYALETYLFENGVYPDNLAYGEPLISPFSNKVLMARIPVPPNVVDGDCNSGDYTYLVNDDRTYYHIEFCTAKEIADLPAGELCLDPGGMIACSELASLRQDFSGDSGVFVDSRDGQSYGWRRYGSQIWMTENLRYTPVGAVFSSSAQYSDTNPYYYVYDYTGGSLEDLLASDRALYYNTYGVLYNKPAAFQGEATSSSSPSTTQGICPDGWLLPSDDDWVSLLNTVGTDPGQKLRSCRQFAGTESASHCSACFSEEACPVSEHPYWNYYPDNTKYSTNEAGFNALGAGIRNESSNFASLGVYTYFWTATDIYVPEMFEYYNIARFMFYGHYNVTTHSVMDNEAISIRCVKYQ